MKPSEVIREARSVLFERGWNRDGRYVADDGSVCIVGALQAVGGDKSREPTWTAWTTCEGVVLDLGCTHVARFNDHEAESFDDVLEVLDRAEKIAEQREAEAL